jgi:hypothetical protein
MTSFRPEQLCRKGVLMNMNALAALLLLMV